MDDGFGIACGACDTFNPMGSPRCSSCGSDLSLVAETGASAGASGEEQQPMEQARYYVCEECSAPVPPGHKFCGACGATVPEEVVERPVAFFGAIQQPGKARLILIRGDQGVEGVSYLLQGAEHFAGRQEGPILFPEDTWLSARHANFFYQGDRLVVRDEGSANGVYLRIRQPVELQPGEHFLCGEQVFRLDRMPPDTSGPEEDGTAFYASPRRPSPFRVVQILRGGAEGMVFCARDNAVQIGRENSDMNFPDDVYMSGNHARVEMSGSGAFSLADSNSKNGTFVRIDGEQELKHGDYLFLGHQLLRVEMTQ